MPLLSIYFLFYLEEISVKISIALVLGESVSRKASDLLQIWYNIVSFISNVGHVVYIILYFTETSNLLSGRALFALLDYFAIYHS